MNPLLTQLVAIAEGRQPLPTHKINVRTNTEDEPLIRRLTKVAWVDNPKGTALSLRSQGTAWLRWHWDPEPRSDGRMDCGYAGMHESHQELIKP